MIQKRSFVHRDKWHPRVRFSLRLHWSPESRCSLTSITSCSMFVQKPCPNLTEFPFRKSFWARGQRSEVRWVRFEICVFYSFRQVCSVCTARKPSGTKPRWKTTWGRKLTAASTPTTENTTNSTLLTTWWEIDTVGLIRSVNDEINPQWTNWSPQISRISCLFSRQELGKTWEEVQSEDDRELADDEDEWVSWGQWFSLHTWLRPV